MEGYPFLTLRPKVPSNDSYVYLLTEDTLISTSYPVMGICPIDTPISYNDIPQICHFCGWSSQVPACVTQSPTKAWNGTVPPTYPPSRVPDSNNITLRSIGSSWKMGSTILITALLSILFV